MPRKQHKNLLLPQRKLGFGGLMTLLIISIAFPPLSLDMYTPALPSMTSYFDTSASLVNISLSAFYLFYAVGILIFGTMSDKFGRKPVLLGGTLVYTLACLCSAASFSVFMLIACRAVKGIAAGAVTAVSTALIKDCFIPEVRERMLALMLTFSAVGPVLAPIIGSTILLFAPWRGVFVGMAVLGAICTVLALLFEESLLLEERLSTGVVQSMGRLIVVGRNKGFMLLLLVTTLCCIPFMAYISVGSYVYIEYFGLTEQGFSYFFAACAALSALGPTLSNGLNSVVGPRKVTWIFVVASLLIGLAIAAAGHLSVLLFWALMSVLAILETAFRPYSTAILLDQQEGDTGTASGLMNFTATILGVVGMSLATLPWPNFIFGVGVIATASMVLAALLWVFLLKSSIPLKGLK